MNPLICPVCKNALIEDISSFRCVQNHLFDKARSGYVNLLLPNRKHSKEPGDNKEMVKNREAFLTKGYYSKISDLLNQEIALTSLIDRNILDVGCGNGYYLRRLQQNLNKPSECWGVDISKEAINLAAKKTKDIHWIISNIAELPFADHSMQILISVFSPLNFSELKRLLHKNGYLYVITPSENHLYELRQKLFTDVKIIKNDRILQECERYLTLFKQITLKYMITLNTNEEIVNLFSMTPYYWRCTPDKKQQILNLTNLELTIDVCLNVFQHPMSLNKID